jgi:type I restriction enzyme S subunit
MAMADKISRLQDRKVMRLDELGIIVTGKTPSTKIPDHFDGDTPFITPSDMDGRRIISKTMRYLTAKGVLSVSGAQIPKGAIMVSCIGSDMGKVAIAGRAAVTNQQINSIIVSKDFSNLYVYYNLCMRKAEFQHLASGGSALPILNKRHFSQLQIAIPPLKEQQAIACILGALDDKIELNRRMNRTLEEMARALFKSWFVDFEPVRCKAAGQQPPGLASHIADFFPDSFEKSEIGEIPRGWKVHILANIFEINPSRQLSKGIVAPYLDMANMPTQGHSPEYWINREYGSGMKFINGDTLLARITPCLENGKTAYVDFLKEGEVGWGSTEYIVLRPREPIPTIFGYLLARTDDFRAFAIQRMTGSSGRQRVPAESISHYRLAAPSALSSIFKTFGQLTNPMFERMRLAMEQSRTLSIIRDALLPKLISGELRVPDAERIVGRCT